jgi:hypothetical protein
VRLRWRLDKGLYPWVIGAHWMRNTYVMQWLQFIITNDKFPDKKQELDLPDYEADI